MTDEMVTKAQLRKEVEKIRADMQKMAAEIADLQGYIQRLEDGARELNRVARLRERQSLDLGGTKG